MATVEAENAMKVGEDSIVVRNKRKSMRKQRKSMFLPRFGCFRLGDESATFDKKNQDGSTDMVSDRGVVDHHPHPTHLIVMVNGIIGRLVLLLIFVNGLSVLFMFEVYILD